MKKVAKSVMLISALAAAGSAVADMGDMNPYIGIDYHQAWMKAKNEWAGIFPKDYPGASIYVGTKFHENFGLELGYDWSVRRKKDVNTMGSFLGKNLGANTLTTHTKIRRSGGHLDLVGFLPVADSFELSGALGFGWVQPKINITADPIAGSTVDDLAETIGGKGKGVFRVGVGGRYMVTDMVGVRGKLGWESTSSLRLKGSDALGLTHDQSKAFKGSTTLSVGAFVKF